MPSEEAAGPAVAPDAPARGPRTPTGQSALNDRYTTLSRLCGRVGTLACLDCETGWDAGDSPNCWACGKPGKNYLQWSAERNMTINPMRQRVHEDFSGRTE